jgi:hypothetical protein
LLTFRNGLRSEGLFGRRSQRSRSSGIRSRKDGLGNLPFGSAGGFAVPVQPVWGRNGGASLGSSVSMSATGLSASVFRGLHGFGREQHDQRLDTRASYGKVDPIMRPHDAPIQAECIESSSKWCPL